MPIPFTALVNQLPATTPFVGPEALERQRGKPFRARIGANESAFGISPLAAQAMQQAVARSAWYADPESHELRTALATIHRVDIDEICVDAGIDTLLGLTVRMLLETDSKAVTSAGAYPTFNYHVAGFGAELVTVPYRGFHENPDALLEAVHQHNAPLVYLANPDNPMGTWHGEEKITSMINAIPDNCVLALDEAYIEFADQPIAPPVDTSNPRVIRFRTFSKAYGMAGQRIAYAIAHRDLISGFNKIRNHFGLNRVAQIGALASLNDTDFIPQVMHAVQQGRQQVMELASSLDLYAEPSYTNFVAVDLQTTERAKKMLTLLADNDIFMRMPGVEPLNRCIRVGLGTSEEFELFSEVFSDLLKSL
ncbi:histidinol-phosphate aminotransferase [Chromatiales bacterium (ex Bugula neritina AB1)]|nr:histidinol-phosphate aminotransferase [Chromatiales bacterium (ex Bugula neritina AB1)]